MRRFTHEQPFKHWNTFSLDIRHDIGHTSSESILFYISLTSWSNFRFFLRLFTFAKYILHHCCGSFINGSTHGYSYSVTFDFTLPYKVYNVECKLNLVD